MSKYMPKEMSRIQKLIQASESSAPPALVPYIKKLEPVLAALGYAATKIIPIYMVVADKLEMFFKICPPDLLTAILGVIVCFFGGLFPTVIAAAEAWNVAGGAQATESLQIAYSQFKKVQVASAADDKEDKDGDGVADVDQIDAQELLKRKMHLALTTIQPTVFQNALSGVYTGWIGVMASLKLQFAKTIALGAAIGKMIQRPAEMFLTPVLSRVMPKDYHPWIEVIIGTLCKSIAVSIAWTIQRIISAFHSAIRGGLMFSRGIMRYLNAKKYISFDEDDSYLDEAVGWVAAGFGFMFQLKLRFTVPWIISILLWPFTLAEWYITWTISE